MKQITIRRVSEDIYERLKDRAKLHDRSLEAEVRSILEQAAKPDPREFSRWAKAFRKRFEGKAFQDSTAIIRADRDSR